MTEAGLGHVVPMEGIADEFEKMYGDKVECVRSQFFTEGGDPKLIEFENRLKNEVVKHNKSFIYGFFATFNMEFWRIHLSTWATMTFLAFGSRNRGIRHMDELRPDLVISTHWAPNYYAVKCKSKPLTAMYCTDARVNPLFSYKCDLVLVSNTVGYNDARRRHPIRFNDKNFRRVPFIIKDAAFKIDTDKVKAREKLGFDTDRFTVVVAEGGYGIGKMEEIVKIVLERDLPVTLVAVCGRNEELYKKFLKLESKGRTDFRPMGLIDNMFDVLVTADVFCGKSGSMMLEPCFFGIPAIITKYATEIEQYIGEYYIKHVGSAIKIFNPQKVVDKIEEFMARPELLQPLKAAAEAQHGNYGAADSAKCIFEMLCHKYPHLKETDAN